jgi:hypothetical protein
MKLKAKLYILKNPTFLLLGPSSFELWFESYLSITVGSLYFLKLATGSSFVYLSPPLLCFSAARRRRSASHVPCTSPPQSRPEAGHVPPQHLPRRSPASHWLLPVLPRRPAVCPSRLSPLLTVAATPAPPPTSRRSYVSLPSRPPP